ncbi:MAG: GNAT family N-acetyltransferase [Pyrinomonadaceae bacterium]
MPDNVKIEQMQLSDKEKLLSFLREAYAENPRMSDERFWTWHFLENPYVTSDNLPVWLAKSGERIAGQLAAIPVNLKVGGERKRAMWILDMIVHEDFRRQGIAKRLTLKSEEYCKLGLGVNTMEQHAPALLQGLGWKIIGKIPRYSKMLHAGNVLPEISRVNPLRKTFNFLSIPFRPRADKSLFEGRGKLRVIEKFDSSFDKLWDESGEQWTCAVARDSALLEWLYIKQPGKKFDIIGYFERDRLLGYAVLFVRKAGANGAVSKAAITDLCYHPSGSGEIIDELLRGSLQIAAGRGAGVLVTDAVDTLIDDRLRSCGFARVKNPLQLMVKSNENQDLLYDANKWFLTRGDSDISIFEHPNL